MNIFIAFAHEDIVVRDKLLRQLNLVKDREDWNIWSSKEIKAGTVWDEEIKDRLKNSEGILLLLSPDFFNSKYINDVELPEIIKRHSKGGCQIIPVIARICHWKDTKLGEYAELGSIQALPVDEKPILSKGWDNDDQPYFECVRGIREAIKEFKINKADVERQKREDEEAKLREEQRRKEEIELRIFESQKLAQLQREKEESQRLEMEKQRRQEEEFLPFQKDNRAQKKSKSPVENISTKESSIDPDPASDNSSSQKQGFSISKPLVYALLATLLIIASFVGYNNYQKAKEAQLKAQEEAEWQETLKKLYPEGDSTGGGTAYINQDSAVQANGPKSSVSLSGIEGGTPLAGSVNETAAAHPSTTTSAPSAAGTSSKPASKGSGTATGVGSGKWEVRAGTFSMMEAARIRMEEVIRVGYTNAEIRKRSDGKTVVIVMRTNDKNKATQAADRLLRKGVDAGVFVTGK